MFEWFRVSEVLRSFDYLFGTCLLIYILFVWEINILWEGIVCLYDRSKTNTHFSFYFTRGLLNIGVLSEVCSNVNLKCDGHVIVPEASLLN